MTTYQITAEFLVQKHGTKAALELARGFSNSRHGSGREFWNYVLACIAQIVEA